MDTNELLVRIDARLGSIESTIARQTAILEQTGKEVESVRKIAGRHEKDINMAKGGIKFGAALLTIVGAILAAARLLKA